MNLDVFVNPEYIIANVMLLANKRGNNSITMKELIAYSRAIEDYWKENDIDALVAPSLGKYVRSTTDFPGYSDYFRFEKINDDLICLLKQDVTHKDLEYRFMGFLPLKVLKTLYAEEVIEKVFKKELKKSI